MIRSSGNSFRIRLVAVLVAATTWTFRQAVVGAFAPHAPLERTALPQDAEQQFANILPNKEDDHAVRKPSFSVQHNKRRKRHPSMSRNKTQKKKIQRPQLDSALPNNNSHTNKKRRSSPGLTKDEELEFSHKIRTFRAAMKLREQLVRHEHGMYIHPTETEWAKACGTSVPNLRRLIEEGQEARAALVAANAGLVIQLAKRHYTNLKQATEAGGGVGTILTVSDMIQEGNMGLMEAAERFQPEKGFRFSTYATYWVRQRILRCISDSSRIIRLPVHVTDTLQKIRKAKAAMKDEMTGGREPNLTELAHYMEIPEEKLRLYTSSSRNVVSLERPLHSPSLKEDTRTIGDIVASDAPTPEEDAVQNSMRRDIRDVMENELGDAERQILELRFGLNNHSGKPLTVAETAAALDLSRDRVRLLEAKALNKLRHPNTNYKLKEYIQKDESSPSSSELETTTFRLEETFANSPGDDSKPDRLWFF